MLGVDEKDGVPVLPVRGIPRGQIDEILKKLFQYCHMIEPYNLAATGTGHHISRVTTDET